MTMEKKLKENGGVSRGEFIIEEYANHHYEIKRLYISRNAKKALTEIWENNGKGEVPPTWNTQHLGKKILDEFCNGKNTGTVGEYEIDRDDQGRISVIRTYSNRMQGLRECVKAFNFKVDDNWTNLQIVARLIKHIKALNEAEQSASSRRFFRMTSI